MNQYITRVELHAATESDYEKLHLEMAKKGFSRSIVSDGGETYRLPTAEYSFTGHQPLNEVHDLALRGAREVKSDPWVLTIQVQATRFNLQLSRTLLRR